MYLYIDKENIESLIKSKSHKLYDDCFKAIKKQFNVFFNFSKKEMKSNELLMPWFQLLVDGVGNDSKFTFLDDMPFPVRPITKDIIQSFNDNKLSAVYLLSDENIHHLKNVGAVLVGAPGEEIQIFNQLFLLQNDYDFHKEIKIGSPELNKWDNLKKYATPLTDIIFVDSYILADVSLISSNLICYLEILCAGAKNKVNIVLYVNNKNVSITLEIIKEQVVTAISRITGHTPNFTLIQYTSVRDTENLGEHDRTIFTNYIRIKSGDSYNYFNSTGEVITKGREITYNSLAKKESHDLAKTLIADLQSNINFLKSNGTSIKGDKISNYLNFS